MKKLIGIIVILLSNSVFAALPDIIALVNDQPITKYDFESRKKMVMVLNNIDNSSPSVDAKLNNGIINVLIEEELLNQHAASVGGKITSTQIDNAISTIEQRNNMPNGGMAAFMKERGLQMESFKKQIAGEIIKHNIVSSLSNSVSVSPLELDVAVINTDMPKFNIEAWIFTSKGNEHKDHKQMQDLKKRLYDCNKVDQKLYDSFAEAEKFDRKLDDMPFGTKSIIQDTKVGATSSVYKEDGKFKLVFVCKKESTVSSGDLSKLKTFLSNKKMSQKATKFFKDLKAKAYIKMMISN
ncbi:SurA-related peptidylprolyl isomerase [Candidatus Megaera venefica]|uniref:SurA-related peptidylprolyl isomerase n=1 Tax=Candidatus Megaera venefica TaxID=2055910 RepID=A0ABU5NAV0_9RICK|nr:SurA N-terminal domain-containing protein [Candidatus Megaera venefica]MEA0970293.1 SurA-related peptidylprolyl isomerase [Candidatus Megaera venefica]